MSEEEDGDGGGRFGEEVAVGPKAHHSSFDND